MQHVTRNLEITLIAYSNRKNQYIQDIPLVYSKEKIQELIVLTCFRDTGKRVEKLNMFNGMNSSSKKKVK